MSRKVKVVIDGKELSVPAGEKILWSALEHDIYIPHLCGIQEKDRPLGGCRLCFVEIEGENKPVTSCTRGVADGMVVHTRTPKVDRLVKTAFELLLSDHRLGCAQCPKNKNCALQRIAKERGLKLKQKRFPQIEREHSVDDTPQTFAYDPSRCVLCGRCVWKDRQVKGTGVLGFTGRSINRRVSTFMDLPMGESSCEECQECVEVCPVGALYFKE